MRVPEINDPNRARQGRRFPGEPGELGPRMGLVRRFIAYYTVLCTCLDNLMFVLL